VHPEKILATSMVIQNIQHNHAVTNQYVCRDRRLSLYSILVKFKLEIKVGQGPVAE